MFFFWCYITSPTLRLLWWKITYTIMHLPYNKDTFPNIIIRRKNGIEQTK